MVAVNNAELGTLGAVNETAARAGIGSATIDCASARAGLHVARDTVGAEQRVEQRVGGGDGRTGGAYHCCMTAIKAPNPSPA